MMTPSQLWCFLETKPGGRVGLVAEPTSSFTHFFFYFSSFFSCMAVIVLPPTPPPPLSSIFPHLSCLHPHTSDEWHSKWRCGVVHTEEASWGETDETGRWETEWDKKRERRWDSGKEKGDRLGCRVDKNERQNREKGSDRERGGA